MKDTRKAAKPIWMSLGEQGEAKYRKQSEEWLALKRSGVNPWHNARRQSGSKKTKTAYAIFLDDFKEAYRSQHPGTDIKVPDSPLHHRLICSADR